MKPVWVLGLWLLFVVPVQAQSSIEQVWQIVHDKFLDANFKGVDWNRERQKALRQVGHAPVVDIINGMLASLHTSHTHYYTPDDPMYWYLASTFGTGVKGAPKKMQMIDPGLFTRDGYVIAVLDGSPAAQAGIHVGDRIEHSPWRLERMKVTIQHTADAKPIGVWVTPHAVDPQAALVDATRKSKRIIDYNGKRIGYIHAWAFTNDDVQPLVHEALQTPCDAFILDLRDGLGGGSLEFMLPWLQAPHLTFVRRGGETLTIPPKPPRTIVLTNDGTRSGKEIFAYTFKKLGLGTLVGANTAGAVSAGQPFYLTDGSLLYLAVARVLVDGEDLEGTGVAPDVPVSRPIPYCNGADPQLDAAVLQIR